MSKRQRPHSEVLEDAILLNERNISYCKHRIKQADRKYGMSERGEITLTDAERRELRKMKRFLVKAMQQSVAMRETFQASWLKHRRWEGHAGPERFDAGAVLTEQQQQRKQEKRNAAQDRDGRRPAQDDEQHLAEDQGASGPTTVGA